MSEPSSAGRDAVLRDLDAGALVPLAGRANLSRALGDVPVVAHVVIPYLGVSEDGLQSAVEVLVLRESSVLYWSCWEQADDEDGAGDAAHLESRTRLIPLSGILEVWVNQALPLGGDLLPDELRLTMVLAPNDRITLSQVSCGSPECTHQHGMAGDLAHEALVFGGSRAELGDETVEAILDFAFALGAGTTR